MASEQFSLCWDNFHKNMSSGMNSLLENEDLVDVTLAVEGKYLKAHKMVLSVCSPYFKELFKTNPCKHPIVFMKDVSYVAMSDLLQFMYQGEVQVSQENLTTFIKTAEALQIKGLTGDGNGATENEVDHERSVQQLVDDYKPDYKPTTVPRPKKLPAPAPPPAPKRQRLSTSSDVSTTSNIVAKTEPVSNITGEVVQFKMEPYDQSQSINIQDDDEQFGGESLDDTVGDDTEDYSMMEGNEEEPQAGTSAEGSGEGQDSADSMEARFNKAVAVRIGYKGRNHQLYTSDQYASLLVSIKEAKNNVRKKTPEDYHRLSKYDVLEIGGTERLIAIRNEGDPIVEYVHLDEVFGLIHECHVGTGHGGREKMMKELKPRYKNVTRELVMVYLSLCEECDGKKRLIERWNKV